MNVDDETADQLTAVLETFATAMHPCVVELEKQGGHNAFEKIVMDVVRACKGMLSVLDPSPPHCCLQSARFIMPPIGHRAPIISALPRLGRSLVAGIRRDGSNT